MATMTGAIASAFVMLAWPSAAWGAIPVTVTRVAYDDSRRRLTLDVTGEAEIRARQVDRRIILEIPDARLRGGPYSQAPTGKRVRSILISQVAGNPPLVRIELLLVPGVEPLLSIQQSAGKIYVVLGDPPPPEGERDLERLPEVPRGALPRLEDRSARPERPAARAVIPPSPSPAMSPVRPAQSPPTIPQPSPPPLRPETIAPMPPSAASPAPARPEAEPAPGSKSFVILSFQQSEFVEAIPSKRLTGFPTGPAGLEIQQWVGDYLGLGLEVRYLSWVGKGDFTADRQDGLAVVRLGARYPLGFVEPELHLASLTRFQAMGPVSLWDPFAPAVGGGVRFQVADALGLRVWGQYFPVGIGADPQAYRAGATVFLGLGPMVMAVGYTHDDTTVLGGKVTADTAVLGAGLQW